MESKARENAKSLLAAPPRIVNVGLELFAIDLAGQANDADTNAVGPRVVHVQWTPPAGGNAHLAGLLGKLRS